MSLFNRFKVTEKPTTKATGDAAEDSALEYLLAQGLTLVCRNYRCKMGEIDLIMQHNNTRVFVEVRLRKSNRFGSAVETVTSRKQQKVIRAAEHYLMQHKLSDTMPLRFDVIGLDGNTINWIQAAF